MNKETYRTSIALVCSVTNCLVCFTGMYFLTDETIIHNLYEGEPLDYFTKSFIYFSPILAVIGLLSSLIRYKKIFDDMILHAYNFIFLFFMLGVLLKMYEHALGKI